MIVEALRHRAERHLTHRLLVRHAIPFRVVPREDELLPSGFVVIGRTTVDRFLALLRRALVGQLRVLDVRRGAQLLVFLDELEEGVLRQLLLQVLLQLEERHVQHVHRLVEAWIGPELLPEPRRGVETGAHAQAAGPAPRSARKRSRSRAVSVGPK